MIRVLIVDDQQQVRAGISMLLSAEEDIEVIGQASSGHQALALSRDLSPDIVLMDVRMPGMDGVTATAELIRQNGLNPDHLVKVLIMTTFDDEDVVVSSLQAGASGYLLKHASPTEISDALRRVAGGDTWLDATAATRLVSKLRERGDEHPNPAELLTPREQEVLRHVAAGQSNQEILQALVLSEATVKTHVARILFKTGSRDRAAVVALAYRSGFVRPDDQTPG